MRGWGWIDPTKEVTAYKEAVKAGFTTVADVIAQTAGGHDLEDVLEQRRQELDQKEEADLSFDTSPENYIEKDEPAPAFGKPPAAAEPKPAEKPDDEEEEVKAKQLGDAVAAMSRVADGMHSVAKAISEQKPAVVNVPETVVHVRAPEVHVQPPAVHVDFKAPDVHVAAPQVHVAAPQVTVVENKVEPTPVTVEVSAPEVHVAAPTVNAPVRVEMPGGETVQDIERDANGEITKVTTRRTA